MMATASADTLTDAQLDAFCDAILDFHSLLTGISSRFQSRMRQMEQDFSAQRAAIPRLGSKPPSLPTLDREVPMSLPRMETVDLSEEHEAPDYNTLETGTTNPHDEDDDESFDLLDFDDDDDF